MPPAVAIGASNLWPPVGQEATSAQPRPRHSSPPEPGADADAAITCGTRSRHQLWRLWSRWEVMRGRGCSSDCGSNGGGERGLQPQPGASLSKASLIAAASCLLAYIGFNTPAASTRGSTRPLSSQGLSLQGLSHRLVFIGFNTPTIDYERPAASTRDLSLCKASLIPAASCLMASIQLPLSAIPVTRVSDVMGGRLYLIN